MNYDPDFKRQFLDGYILVTVNILYFLPDYNSLINEFIWQTLDLKPKYPKVNKFLKYWDKNINANIKEVIISENSKKFVLNEWRNGIILNI